MTQTKRKPSIVKPIVEATPVIQVPPRTGMGLSLPTLEAADKAVAAWMEAALREVGTRELLGRLSNPDVEKYLATTRGVGVGDEIPWCSAFVNWCVQQAGLEGTDSRAARSWLKWGVECGPKPGAICVLWREDRNGGKGHVGFYRKASTRKLPELGVSREVILLGGNQANRVREAPFPQVRVLGYRWPA